MDDARRPVTTRIWYPALVEPEAPRIRYFGLLDGQAQESAAPDRRGAPYPILLFSHGNKGLNFQSISLTEALASHGFVVVAPNHAGNTLFDNPDDSALARVALARPGDLAFALAEAGRMDADASWALAGLADAERLGVIGHSFGGFTALQLAGGSVDVNAAVARCDAGVANDVFCDPIRFWPRNQVIRRPAGFEALKAALALAPGGYSAFGEVGIAEIDVPTMVMGGTLDAFTGADLRPIFDALPSPALAVEIAGLGHMGFTDICRLPIAATIPDLAELCDPAVFLDVNRGFEIINPLVIAFLRKHVAGEASGDAFLSAEYSATVPEVTFSAR